MKAKLRILTAVLVSLVLAACAGMSSAPETATIIPEVVAKKGIVASAHQIGRAHV